ncbi:MAG TPA: DUF6055 domain-containing protein [Nocardioides sp.]|uniref:MXAN_6640 family putative metalloprotease n=1 Tax=Nocardioides sp. TaxID=35761 RepID=UPI002C062132|nr:MXAN_6640 family putative metalloprotease [Nocardioides sp.]HQR26304.1 DUF6055 domain-containing protein [Nocardioides sp.]
MRRTLAAGLALLTALVLVGQTPASAEDEQPAAQQPSPAAPPTPTEAEAERTLEVATQVLSGNATATDPSPTLALRDLRQALPALGPAERRSARALLARPTDGPRDDFGDGYTVPSVKRCSAHVCVHWVRSTPDAPATPAWVDTTLTQLNRVWRLEVGRMGFRAPLPDGTRGGNAKLDVYLKDVGAKGYYGYCASERRAKGYTFSGYCVLDNDYDPVQFGGAPLDSLRVTAAHEFFHAVQYAYDAAEDPWFMESTATWMEERFADGVNDNRQYLPYGQLGQPQSALDSFASGGFQQYGNWIWWEFLSDRFGNDVVRTVWRRAASYPGAPDDYSTQALVRVLRTKGGFTRNFGVYAASNTAPAAWYPEGADWTGAPMAASYTLQTGTPGTGSQSVTANHMASRSVRIVPGSTLSAPGWTLRLSVDGPASQASPAVVVVVAGKDGTQTRTRVTLDAGGRGTGQFAFGYTDVASVTVTMANASTRFACWRGTDLSCKGTPRDNGKKFAYSAVAVQP